MLADILSRLHVRSLLRFKYISKFWKTLIDEPHFSRKHLNHAKNDQSSQKVLLYQLHLEKGIISICCGPTRTRLSFKFLTTIFQSLLLLRWVVILRVYENIVERQLWLYYRWLPTKRKKFFLRKVKILKIDEYKNDGCKVPVKFSS